ncbi:hypothetical protein TeGR_g12990, partial [Tetraparma gracilis]
VPGDEFIAQTINKEYTRRWQNPLQVPSLSSSGITSSFTWASADDKCRVPELNAKMQAKFMEMKKATERNTGHTQLELGASSPHSRSYKSPQVGPAGYKRSTFQFSRPKLSSQEYGCGPGVDEKYKQRVPVATWKKWGGPCVHALTMSEEEGGVGGAQAAITGGGPPPIFIASEKELEERKRELEREKEGVERRIQEHNEKNAEVRRMAAEAKRRLNRSKKVDEPLAKSCAQMAGDASLKEIAKIKAKPVTKAAVSSDEMHACMKALPRRPETAPKKKVKVLNKNAKRSFEADFHTWQNELGKH